MSNSAPDAPALLASAAGAKALGDLDAARAAYVRAYDAARAVGDVEAMTQAALGMASNQMFGTVPGRLPAFLHEAYKAADGIPRARLAVAIAKAWAYGGEPARAVEFVDEAITTAEETGDKPLLAEALDAQLLVNWGPDDLDARLAITKRLEDTASFLDDVEAQMSAYLWRLTTAMECLDVASMRRQLRALDVIAEESRSPRVRFFAASRRGMHALLIGDTAGARQALAIATAAGNEAGEADTFAIERVLTSGIARQEEDLETVASEAEGYERFGIDLAMQSVAAEGTNLWLEVGRPDRARSLLSQLAGYRFETVTRDFDWLLTMTCLTRAAAAVGDEPLCAEAIQQLEPYAGRGVANAGGVAFHGVVDHFLMLACQALGRDEAAAAWRSSAAAAYERLGAAWWARLLDAATTTAATAVDDRAHLHPIGDGLWQVGRGTKVATVRDMKGLQYLRLLLRTPGMPLRAADLSDAVAGHAGTRIDDRGDDVIDRVALDAYRRRLAELDEDIAEAQEWSDAGRLDRLEAEKDALLEQVAQATGLGGRTRRTASTDERARVAVRKAIAAALSKLEEIDPLTARLLTDTVHTGSTCSYDPDPARPTEWILDRPA